MHVGIVSTCGSNWGPSGSSFIHSALPLHLNHPRATLPEVLAIRPEGRPLDTYSLGVLIFEVNPRIQPFTMAQSQRYMH